MQEYVANHPKRLILTYDWQSRLPSGRVSIGDFVYGDERLRCVYGIQTVSWIGDVDSDLPPYVMADRIREGQLLGMQPINNHLCYLIEWKDQWFSYQLDERVTATWRFFVDNSAYVIRRLEAELETDQRGVYETRQKIFNVMEVSREPHDIDWNIWPLIEPHLGEPSSVDPNPGADIVPNERVSKVSQSP